MKVILTGSLAFDYLMKFPGLFKDHILPDHLDKISLSFLVDDMARRAGGVGSNIAYTLALLGGNSYLYSSAGDDFVDYSHQLARLGVDVSGVKIVPGQLTASFFATTDLSNAQIASFYSGAMAESAHMPLAEADYAPDDFVMVSPSDPRAMQNYISESAQLGLRMIFDPGQQVVRADPCILKDGIFNAYGLFVNDYEFELLQKCTGLSAEQILSYPAFSVVTMGKDGARLYTADENLHVPAVPDVKIVDPTGVGDAFRAGFLRGYMAGLSLQVCGEMGTIAAAFCIQNDGPQNHFFTWDEFKSSYRKYFDDRGELEKLNRNNQSLE